MGKQHLGPHVVVGYGIKFFWPRLFITSPDHLEVDGFPQVFFLKISLYAKRSSKSENETFLITLICVFTETWVVTQRDIKGHIKGNQNPQNNMIASFSFSSTAHVTPNGRII